MKNLKKITLLVLTALCAFNGTISHAGWFDLFKSSIVNAGKNTQRLGRLFTGQATALEYKTLAIVSTAYAAGIALVHYFPQWIDYRKNQRKQAMKKTLEKIAEDYISNAPKGLKNKGIMQKGKLDKVYEDKLFVTLVKLAYSDGTGFKNMLEKLSNKRLDAFVSFVIDMEHSGDSRSLNFGYDFDVYVSHTGPSILEKIIKVLPCNGKGKKVASIMAKNIIRMQPFDMLYMLCARKLIHIDMPLNSDDQTALQLFVDRNSNGKFEELLKLGADPNKKDKNGKTAYQLHIDRYYDGRFDSRLVKTLLQYGADLGDLNICDTHGFTPLTRAVDCYDPELVQMLIDKGAKPDVPNALGQRSLVIPYDYRTIGILLKAGANPNKLEIDAISPLQKAVENRNFGAVELLVKAGAQLKIKDDESGQTISAFEFARNCYDAQESKVRRDASIYSYGEDWSRGAFRDQYECALNMKHYCSGIVRYLQVCEWGYFEARKNKQLAEWVDMLRKKDDGMGHLQKLQIVFNFAINEYHADTLHVLGKWDSAFSLSKALYKVSRDSDYDGIIFVLKQMDLTVQDTGVVLNNTDGLIKVSLKALDKDGKIMCGLSEHKLTKLQKLIR